MSSERPRHSTPPPLPAGSAVVAVPPEPSITESLRKQEPVLRSRRMPLVTILSVLLHAIVLASLTLIVIEKRQLVEEIFTSVTDVEESVDPIDERSLIQMDTRIDETPTEPLVSEATSIVSSDVKGPLTLNVSDGAPQLPVEVNDSLAGMPGINVGDEISGRMSAENRRTMAMKFGGSTASEAAVASGMKWISTHQMPNGSWNFVHSTALECKGKCSQDGSVKSCPTGATALALLAFLGGGHTHQKGDYTSQFKRGIDYLLKSGKKTPEGLDFRGTVVANEGMYAHGLCAIALCECAAMTTDPRVKKAAEGALEFIVKAQNPNDGGWRYHPGDAGDTSVVGWQVMALKSGHNAKIPFTTDVFKGAQKYLQLAQSEGGARYRYEAANTSAAPTESMTAVGLLCRMYLGWDRRNGKLGEGVGYLDKVKPLPNNMYYNYYATQVMHHWGGDEWARWNEVMRDQLIRTQHPLKDGHLAGSWDIADVHGGAGGRLYMTCLCVMTLEVYYRHLPMYSREHLKVEF